MIKVLQLLYKGICFWIDRLPVLIVIVHLNIFGMDLPIKALGVFLTNLGVLLITLILAALLVEDRRILVLPVEHQVAFHIVER